MCLSPDLVAEVASRWDLLEAAFAMRLPVEALGTAEHMLYRIRGYDRIDITGVRPVLNGYQNGRCFYCDEALEWERVHVDHVIPRSFLHHDEIWNLVLADEACNLAKSAQLPARAYLEQLYERNESYIASDHPIKRHLVAQMGPTKAARRAFLERVYHEARHVLVHTRAGMASSADGVVIDHPLAPLCLTARN